MYHAGFTSSTPMLSCGVGPGNNFSEETTDFQSYSSL